MLKALVLLMFIAAVISLFSGLYFLLNDRGQSRRLVHSLFLRVTFCALLLALVVYGLVTGELETQAPWLNGQ
ncbi:DUF2909 domain-containing protein [Marinobacterium arenosum]|uniref:DUF2909 domain-containing protein n=1 Tax=Marinobacterium arenosum TaxID=2862496 RepID=UPI001C93B44A|nr:DUF2909 domain-containing protein [Marinobacterium arenosum]MBY4675498.1 DUF2909 domain-containing protein [Marinobacterium arenosum]